MEEMTIFLVILYILIGLVCSTVEKLNHSYTDRDATLVWIIGWPLSLVYMLVWYVPEFITDYFAEKFR